MDIIYNNDTESQKRGEMQVPRKKETMTRQTQKVLSLLSEEECHLTADEIQTWLSGIGRATIYRALERLEADHLIQKLSLESGTAVYESVKPPHIHFVCEICGDIKDIHREFPAEIMNFVGEDGGKPKRMDVVVYGTCKKCLISKNKEEKDMERFGFVKRHWKGLAAGAVALATTVGLVAYSKSKKNNEDDDYDDETDIEETSEDLDSEE